MRLLKERVSAFFSLSLIGGNDVLGYATTGGDGTDPITDTATFDYVFNDMVNHKNHKIK